MGTNIIIKLINDIVNHFCCFVFKHVTYYIGWAESVLEGERQETNDIIFCKLILLGQVFFFTVQQQTDFSKLTRAIS